MSATETRPILKHEFELPEEDERELEARCLEWETITDGGVHWLLVHRREVPAVFNQSRVTLAFLVPVGYPSTGLDMVFVYPALTRKDGRAIGATSARSLAGVSYQQWSRHRTAQNPWREGVDGVCTQLDLAHEWFDREATR